MSGTQDFRIAFDHLVIGAADLAQGGAWAQATLRREVPLGGAHPSMGTHNRLARLDQGLRTADGAAPACYLEIIAVDPAAPAPARPRWFALDDADQRRRLAERPRPIAWVLATDDIDAAAARAAAAGWDVGEILAASRGDLSWRISAPRDGRPAFGVMPALIEWPAALGRRAPVARMAPLGLALRELRLDCADPNVCAEGLAALGAAEAIAQAGVRLTVAAAGPDGPRLEAVFGAPGFAKTA